MDLLVFIFGWVETILYQINSDVRTSGFSFFCAREISLLHFGMGPPNLLLTAVSIDNFSVGPGRCAPSSPENPPLDVRDLYRVAKLG
jgi:hypothetical protein